LRCSRKDEKYYELPLRYCNFDYPKQSLNCLPDTGRFFYWPAVEDAPQFPDHWKKEEGVHAGWHDFFDLIIKNDHMATQSTAAPKAAQNSKLREFFIDQLQDIYWAEQKLVKTLPKLSEASHSPKLRQAFDSHLIETKNHVSRIEQAFSLMKEKAESKECPALKGIAKEGEEIIDETEDNTAQRDVGLIFAGQKAEHYEIATYGGLIQLAKDLGEPEVANLFLETLKEEKAADQKLTQLAESGINREAAQEMTA